MPELPEVETVLNGITPHVVGQCIDSVIIRQRRLRYPVTRGLADKITARTILSLTRRGKYLLFRFEHGTVISHLGMSGSFRMVDKNVVAGKHEHFDWVFNSGKVLRYKDARRFGLLLWCPGDPRRHKLLAHLGVEPLGNTFDGEYLHRMAQGRSVAVKNLIMNSRCVVGVGNIYASEALFRAGISPLRSAGRVSLKRYDKLAHSIREVLTRAIHEGGTTLKDFVREDGTPGYFRMSLNVYAREGQPCRQCGKPIRKKIIGQRSTYYCGNCQH